MSKKFQGQAGRPGAENGPRFAIAAGGEFMFCWQCKCGFAMCQSCMYENQWGLTCNGITWYSPGLRGAEQLLKSIGFNTEKGKNPWPES